MLAADLIPALRAAGANLLLADLREGADGVLPLDICDGAAVDAIMQRHTPSWIVNCAAYTAVDKAETDYDAAFKVNAVGVAELARAARANRASMLHISTDYVFGGKGHGDLPREPLTESATLRPCGIYGHSKRFGEELLSANLPGEHLLVRTSWLHGVGGPNFVDTMLKLGAEKPMLKIVNDQYGSPTWTGWLAGVLVSLLERGAKGVYHAASRGGITWYDFAKEIFRQSGDTVDVQTQTSEELARPAPRPPYSVLAVDKLEQLLGKPCITWQECVTGHLQARKRNG